MKPILTPHDGRRWWDSNLHTSTCESQLYHCATEADKVYLDILYVTGTLGPALVLLEHHLNQFTPVMHLFIRRSWQYFRSRDEIPSYFIGANLVRVKKY